MRQKNAVWSAALLCVLLLGWFALLFYTDNKYQTPPPYGSGGVIPLTEEALAQARPIFLIDGWLLSDDRATDQPTWIGEFSSLQRGDRAAPPHGPARYRLTLRYTGAELPVAVDFPELFSRFEITLDGRTLSQGTGSAHVTFLLTPGDHVLTVQTVSRWGYYSGMYYPPALGTPETLALMRDLRSLSYALAVLVPLVLAVFTLVLWRSGGALARWFGLLCCLDALYVSYYFVQLFSLPVAEGWFFVENLALYGLCFCVIRLAALAAEADAVFRVLCPVLLLLPAALLLLCLLIPVWTPAAALHRTLTDLYYVYTFCTAVFFLVRGRGRQDWEARWTRLACAAFGTGLLVNLFSSNRFEPIHFLWQFEWCALLLVLLFGAMMAARNRRILEENRQLTVHLEAQVAQRTAQLTQLLQERKAFFSDMAHDLKAPVFATQSFIAAIRSGGVGLDSELDHYLQLAERKQTEMARRLQGLSTINALDKIQDDRVRISLRDLLEDVCATHRGEAEVASIHLMLHLPEEDAFLLAQRSKLDILFENLVCNAIRATPPEGQITLSAQVRGNTVHLTVADTGCGIPALELPHIFRRFYVGEQNRETGTGLGLYIVQSIVTELGGSICATSVPGGGTTFHMDLPTIE